MNRATIKTLGGKITSVIPNWSDHIYKLIGDVTSVDFTILTKTIFSMTGIYKEINTEIQSYTTGKKDVQEYISWANTMSKEYISLGMKRFDRKMPIKQYMEKHNIKRIVNSPWFAHVQATVSRINELDKVFCFSKQYNGSEKYVSKISKQEVNITNNKYFGIRLDNKEVLDHIITMKGLLDKLILTATTPLYDYKKYIHSRNNLIDSALKQGAAGGSTKQDIENLLIHFTETLYKTKLFNQETTNGELLEVVSKTLNTHIDINDPDYNAKFISMLGELNIDGTAETQRQKSILHKSIQLITDMSKGDTIDITQLDALLKDEPEEDSNEESE